MGRVPDDDIPGQLRAIRNIAVNRSKPSWLLYKEVEGRLALLSGSGISDEALKTLMAAMEHVIMARHDLGSGHTLSDKRKSAREEVRSATIFLDNLIQKEIDRLTKDMLN